MSLNFGPLNQDGGERRLNVLITRAREKCVVFSNFKAYDMKLTANPPYGVKSLKEFLEYAENLTLGTDGPDSYTKEPFEDAIASFLEENGYQVDRQIGCAGFRVDLAIVDEENPGKYILGITTDGKMYSSSKVARDRDRLREQVLTGLGWKLYHLWSTDWYRNRDLGRKKLLDSIEKSIRKTREEEKRRSEEAKKLAEKRRIEAEKKAEELRLAREREEAERKAKEAEEAEEEINPESIGPSDFVEVEKVDDGDILEKPIDVSELDPDEFFGDVDDENIQEPTASEFVTVEESDEKVEYKQEPSEFVGEESLDEAENDINSPEIDSHVVEDDNADSSVDINDEELVVEDVNVNEDLDLDNVDSKDANVNAEVESGFDDVKPEKTSDDDAEVWESENESDNQDDDAEVWESDEGVSPEDNAEVWEDEKDYADETDDSDSMSLADKIKSKFKRDPDEPSAKESILSAIRFSKDLGKNEEFNEDIINDFKDKKPKNESKEDSAKEEVDLGFDDDYIYVDHSNDESSEDYKEEEFDVEDYVAHEEMSNDDEIDVTPVDVPEESVNDKKSKKSSFKDKISFKSDIDMDLDDVNVDEDMGSKFDNVDVNVDDDVDSKFDDVDVNVGDVKSKSEDVNVDDVDSKFEGVNVKEDDSNIKEVKLEETKSQESDINDDKVDLGSDDDYIYVDHSNDEPSSIDADDLDSEDIDNAPVSEIGQSKTKSRRSQFVKSIISEVVSGESKLEPEEIEILRGEIIDEDDVQLHKPAPKDELVVEAEIVNGDESSFERPDSEDFFEEDEELNIFTDTLLDLNNNDYDDDIHNEATRVVDDAMSEFMDEVFNKSGDSKTFDEKDIANHFVDEEIDDINVPDNDYVNEKNIENHFVDEEIDDINVPDNDYVNEKNIENHFVDEEIENVNVPSDEEVPKEESSEYDDSIYFKGANDVTNPLRKNNVYYKDHKSKSIKDSIKGIKKDMQYINKSLNEIENPTQIDYVSVVDRTEEYDPNDYLSRPDDDDSDKIIQMEEESKFVPEETFVSDDFEREIADDVIVPVNESYDREELKDQALENIIQSANEDYKEIEKERFQSNNKLKAFDDKKLPGKKKLEDEIIDYVPAADFGLNSQNDLYGQPINKVAKSITEIVDIEGPIHIKEVTNRVKDSCNIKRAGSNLKKTVNTAIAEAEKSGDIIRIGDFLYDAYNNNVVIRRRNKPNIELISDEEIAKSIELVLLHKSDVSTKQIAKEASRNFGFKSTSKKTASRINGVLDLMIANNRVKIVNDYVELN